MITATLDIMKKIHMKQLELLIDDLIEIAAIHIPSKCLEKLPNLSNFTENKTKGLIS